MDGSNALPRRSAVRAIVGALSADPSGDPAIQRASRLLQEARRELGDEVFERAVAGLGPDTNTDAMVDALELAGGRPMERLREGLAEAREAVQALETQNVANEPIVREDLKPFDTPYEVIRKMGEGDIRAEGIVVELLNTDAQEIRSIDDMNIRGGQLADAFLFAGRSITRLLQILRDPQATQEMVSFVNASSRNLDRKQAAVTGGAFVQRPPLLIAAEPRLKGPPDRPGVG